MVVTPRSFIVGHWNQCVHRHVLCLAVLLGRDLTQADTFCTTAVLLEASEMDRNAVSFKAQPPGIDTIPVLLVQSRFR